MVAVAARSLAAVDDTVTLPQYRALVVLSALGPQPTGQLAEQLGIHQSTATRLCDRLVDKHLVARSVSPANRREVTISITETGAELVEHVSATRRREFSEIVERIPAHLRGPMVRAMRAFADAAGEVPQANWPLGWQ